MEEIRVCVKWGGEEHWILIDLNDNVLTLKDRLATITGVKQHRQKLLNLKYKGKPADDTCSLSELSIKADMKIMMMGSREEDILGACAKPTDIDDVLDDLDQDDEVVAIENEEIYLQKIDKRIKDYNIELINEPRPDKKLLVLDIDYTLFDHRSAAESGYELMRPYLHEFLTAAYQHYDIVIWSATDMKWIKKKMKLLGMCSHADYKIMFYLDSLAMITVHTQKYGIIDVKPLGVIWGKYEQYSPKNTIMFDDIRRNFIMNPNTGLKIRPFKHAHLNRNKDKELLMLSVYLKDIAECCDDFNLLNHRKWEKYRPPFPTLHSFSSRKSEEK